MERAFIMSDGDQIQAEDLAILDDGALHTPRTISPTYGTETAEPAPDRTPASPGAETEEAAPPRFDESFQDSVARYEAGLIAGALAAAGSLRGAARLLQLDPATLLRRKKRYQAQGLLPPDLP